MSFAVDNRPASTRFLEYASLLQGLDPASMETEYRTVAQAARDMPGSLASLQLALLLSYPDSPHYDLDAAIGTLDQLVSADVDAELRGFASLLLMLLGERQRVTADREGLAAQVRQLDGTAAAEPITEPPGVSSEAAERRVRDLLAELELERERGRKLEAQLRGLIELEQQLNQGAVALEE